jgi:hypothetical protein
MEDCCSIPQRDCGRVSRPSLLSATKGQEDNSRPVSKNCGERRIVRGGVNNKSYYLDVCI